MKLLTFCLIAVALLPHSGVSQGMRGSLDPTKQNILANNECFPKGGLGIINTALYISLKSAKNELQFGNKEIWTGFERKTPQVAIFFEGRVWSQQGLPDRFDMSRAVVISFESGVVRFYDFSKSSGGFYKREKSE